MSPMKRKTKLKQWQIEENSKLSIFIVLKGKSFNSVTGINKLNLKIVTVNFLGFFYPCTSQRYTHDIDTDIKYVLSPKVCCNW